MSKSLVLIADIEASRKIEGKEREDLQQRLEKILDALNEQADGLVSPYTITLGDEFQAVFDKADKVFVQILKIMAALHPVVVRFSLGVGEIATPINNEQAIGMDGPAFHEAREGIDILKESGNLINIRIEGEDNLTLKIVNGSLQLLSKQIRSWNKKRITILHMLKEGYDYKAITKELDISRAAFYKNKEAGLLEVVDELSDNIAKVINQKLA
jgi:hypothetical protein